MDAHYNFKKKENRNTELVSLLRMNMEVFNVIYVTGL